MIEIMKRPVKTVDGQMNLETARHLMHLYEVRHLIVVERGRVVGVLSERDLRSPKGAKEKQAEVVQDRMIHHVISATPHTSVREAANLMRGHRIGCLPVLDDEKLVGIVTDTDLLTLLGSGAEAPSLEKTRATMKLRRPRMRQNLPRKS